MNQLYFQGGSAPQRTKKSSNASSVQGGIFGEHVQHQAAQENFNPTFSNMQQRSNIFDEDVPIPAQKAGGKQQFVQYQNTSSISKIVGGEYTHSDGYAKPPAKKVKPSYGYGHRKAMWKPDRLKLFDINTIKSHIMDFWIHKIIILNI